MEHDDLQQLLNARAALGDKRVRDLNELLFELRRAKAPMTKTRLAQLLGVWPSKLTTLLDPESYRAVVNEELAERIAILLNYSASYVVKFYSRSAA